MNNDLSVGQTQSDIRDLTLTELTIDDNPFLPPKPPQASDNRPTEFFDLPPEIRLHVYEYVIELSNPWNCDRSMPTLFLVNRQAFNEAVGVFLRRASFQIHSTESGIRWLDFLRASKLTGTIGHVTYFFDAIFSLRRSIEVLVALLNATDFSFKQITLTSRAASVRYPYLEMFMAGIHRFAAKKGRECWVEADQGSNALHLFSPD